MSKRLKIAIQKKGKLSDPSINFLQSLGLEFNDNGRKLVNPCLNCDIDILYLRSGEIPEYVNRGIADFGIVGQNVLVEKGLEFRQSKPLKFSECELIIAISQLSNIASAQGLEGKRIATSYPRTLKQYLDQNSINAEIVTMSGSVEIAPILDLADAVCDLTQTGNTLKANDLVVIDTILKSEAVLIASPFVEGENILKPYNLNFISL